MQKIFCLLFIISISAIIDPRKLSAPAGSRVSTLAQLYGQEAPPPYCVATTQDHASSSSRSTTAGDEDSLFNQSLSSAKQKLSSSTVSAHLSFELEALHPKPSAPPPSKKISFAEPIQWIPSDSPSHERPEDFLQWFKSVIESKGQCSSASTYLYQAYEAADAIHHKEIDDKLRDVIVQALQSDEAPIFLSRGKNFFELYFAHTHNSKKTLRKALQNILTQEIKKVRIPYHKITHPSKELIAQGRETLDPSAIMPSGCGDTVIKAWKRDRNHKICAQSEQQFTLLRPKFNHAYIANQDNHSLLATFYKHLNWRKKYVLWRDLRQCRRAEEKALGRYYTGLMHMAK